MDLFLLSQEHLPLAREEIRQCILPDTVTCRKNLVLVPSLDKRQQQRVKRLAYTRLYGEVLFQAPLYQLPLRAQQYPFQQVYRNNFFLQTFKAENLAKPWKSRTIADIIYTQLTNPRVRADNPTTLFGLVLTQKQGFVVRVVWQNKERFSERKPQKRKAPHPSSLDPKLARCMINLGCANNVIDPFCGAGGILIEAGRMGLPFRGSDIDPQMVERAKQNLRQQGLPQKVERKDAMQLTMHKKEICITDLPYGKNTKKVDLAEVFKQFVQRIQGERLVVGLPDCFRYQNIMRQTSWRIMKSFSVYLHKNLSKRILIMRRTSLISGRADTPSRALYRLE